MQLVEDVAIGRGCISSLPAGHDFLEDRVERLLDPPIGVLAGLPDIEDAEDAGVLVEAGGVNEEALDRPVACTRWLTACAPAEKINPAVVEAMSEIGVDLAHEFPKPVTDEVVRAAES